MRRAQPSRCASRPVTRWPGLRNVGVGSERAASAPDGGARMLRPRAHWLTEESMLPRRRLGIRPRMRAPSPLLMGADAVNKMHDADAAATDADEAASLDEATRAASAGEPPDRNHRRGPPSSKQNDADSIKIKQKSIGCLKLHKVGRTNPGLRLPAARTLAGDPSLVRAPERRLGRKRGPGRPTRASPGGQKSALGATCRRPAGPPAARPAGPPPPGSLGAGARVGRERTCVGLSHRDRGLPKPYGLGTTRARPT